MTQSAPQQRRRPSTLKLRRLALGLTAEELAAMASISRTQLVRLELGQCSPRLDTARALAAALECDDPLELFPDERVGA